MQNTINRPTRSCNVKTRRPPLPEYNPVVLVSLVYELPSIRKEFSNDVEEIREGAEAFSDALMNLTQTTKALYVEQREVRSMSHMIHASHADAVF